MVNTYRILTGDVIEQLRTLPDGSVHCVVTSPPYWGLRDYGTDGQIGLEPTPGEYVARLVDVFREVRRVLRDDGTVWLNLGDSYAANRGYQVPDGKWTDVGNNHGARVPDGIKPKDLVGIPWRVAFALQQPHLRCSGCGNVAHQDAWGRFPNGRLICPACEKSKGHEIAEQGWWLRSDIIWHKPNPMPESVTDRPTKAHEYVFLLTKSARYYYDADAVREASVDPEGSAKRYEAPFFVVDKHESGGYSANGQRHTAGMKEFNGTRNRRSVWTIATQPYSGAHFAVMPPALVEPCIKAGTSERGCCPECGAPWRRVVERGEPNGLTWQERKNGGEPMRKGYAQNRGDRTGGNTLTSANNTTLGWQPTCACDAGAPVPCTVLDPFGGSGTTVAVALGLQRDGVMIELNPDYVMLARRRIGEVAPLLTVEAI